MLIPLGILAGAGGVAGDYELIETTILGSTTASVTFSSLATYASDYKHLQIRLTARTTRVETGANIILRLNGDTASNYNWHLLLGTGSSVLSLAGANQTYMFGAWVAAANTTANSYGVGVIDFLDSYSTTKNKTIRSLNGHAASENNIRLTSGAWRNTNAISSITLLDGDGGNLVAGSRFSLYGSRG